MTSNPYKYILYDQTKIPVNEVKVIYVSNVKHYHEILLLVCFILFFITKPNLFFILFPFLFTAIM